MTNPRLSIIVIAYDMPHQALNTLKSLAPDYQQGVAADDYEVIVVENRSAHCLDAEAIAALPGNFRYRLRDTDSVSPARAINEALAEARGAVIGLMIDGARLLTPGVLHYALMAYQIRPMAVVAVPGYQLGDAPHHLTTTHSAAADTALLHKICWPEDGYRLFQVSSLSYANRAGFFAPFMESNCLFAPAALFRAIGGADERFDLPGGGALNLYIYHRLANHPEATLFVLPGEGSFHQMHGGVTTTARSDTAETLQNISAQLNDILGEPFTAPQVRPVLLGQLPLAIHAHLAFSGSRFERWVMRWLKPGSNETAPQKPKPDG